MKEIWARIGVSVQFDENNPQYLRIVELFKKYFREEITEDERDELSDTLWDAIKVQGYLSGESYIPQFVFEEYLKEDFENVDDYELYV